MKDIRELLESVPGAYDDFVVAMSRFASKSDNRADSMKAYIESHPEAGPSDIIGYATFELDLLSDNVDRMTVMERQRVAMA